MKTILSIFLLASAACFAQAPVVIQPTDAVSSSRDTINTNFSNLYSAGSTNSSAISGLNTSVNGLNSGLAATNSNLATTNTNVGTNTASIGALNTGFSTIYSASPVNSAAAAKTALAGYWSPSPTQYNIMGTVNPSTAGGAGVPAIGFASWMRQDNANGNDAVPIMPVCIVNVDNGNCFGMNIVLGNNPTLGKPGGSVNPGMTGIEVDIEGYSAPRGVGMSFVEYNVQNPNEAILCRNGNYAVTPPAWGKCIYSEDGSSGVSLYSGSLGIPGAENVTSQHIQFHSNAGGTDYTGEIFADVNGKATLDFTGVAGNSTMVKTASLSACTITTGSAFSSCNTTVTWATPFLDTNYVTNCSIAAATGTPFVVNTQSSTSASAAVVQIANMTTSNTSGQLTCIAWHL